MITLHNGDCLEYMRGMDADSIDAVVTDPPAGISFMGKEWDDFRRSRNPNDAGRENVFGRTSQHAPEIGRRPRDIFIAWMTEIAAECLRVLKPGGYALVWALPRTSHWTATAWEDGGFEVRDRIAYCFGSGFPKSLDVSKAIDKAAGADREVIGSNPNSRPNMTGIATSVYSTRVDAPLTAPATDAAREWAGWGTALKPAVEDWWVFRKPLSEVTVAANVLRWGTGAMNVDGCRVEHSEPIRQMKAQAHGDLVYGQSGRHEPTTELKQSGRWPAHLILDGSPEVEAMFPANASPGNGQRTITRRTDYDGLRGGKAFAQKSGKTYLDHGDTGSAARFFKSCPIDEGDYPPLFYCAKAGKSERDDGLDGLELVEPEGFDASNGGYNVRTWIDRKDGKGRVSVNAKRNPRRNHYPTVKPLSLMRYLVTLVTREGGVVLDPFMGSGTTAVACAELGRDFIGCEMDAEYYAIAQARVERATLQMPLRLEQGAEIPPRPYR